MGNEGKQEFKWVGTRPVRPDGVDKVTGAAAYGADYALPGMLVGRVLRSVHAHARIKSINTVRAMALPGVLAIVTGAEFPDLPSEISPGGEAPINFRHVSQNAIARGKALYEGHALGAVAATTAEIAEQALALIDVDYEVLPHVIDVREAMKPDAPCLHDDLFTGGIQPKPTTPSNIAARVEFAIGNIEEGFAEAEVVLEREYTTQPVHQGYIEPHACVASVAPDGMTTIWCSSQGQFMIREFCAKLLKLENSQIRVIPAEIGGGFGGKTTVYLEPLAVALSRKAGRPVKMVMNREEVFRASGPTSGSHLRVKLGAKRDGTLTAGDMTLAYQAGAFPGSPATPGCMAGFAPYKFKHAKAVGYDVVSNRPKCAAYRAPGAPMASFAVESALDELALTLGMDPLELRLKNATHEGINVIYGPKFPVIGFIDTLEAAKAHPHYNAPLKPNQGRGVACGFWFNHGGQSSASIHLNADGTAEVITGNPDIGGSRASMAMMAAEVLGIDLAKVKPLIGDTASAGYCFLTGGSRVTFATGKAVCEAANDTVRQLRERAAKLWKCTPEEVIWKDGVAFPSQGQTDTRTQLSLAELAKSAAKTGGPINGNAALNVSGAGAGFGVHICDVEVDPETGRVTIIRYTAIQDVGRAIHPSYVEGQMQGGAVQGIGWALNEEYVYDLQGRLQNPGFLDYRMPVASDLPMIDTVMVEVPNPSHPFGVRGVGEVPIVPPLGAVANAVARASGVRMNDLPISPPRLLAALTKR
ncbi:MAG: xanthine dehydrogenase family protein molybdopterin-binding subunit [Gammaproteobacteria bacterium]|nr:xanthine dehydrogenase family protein molybdopterin-binding subunit [Gammaproteobacteria bacterium]